MPSRKGQWPGSGPYSSPGVDMSGSDSADAEASLIWVTGNRPGLGHPLRRLMGGFG